MARWRRSPERLGRHVPWEGATPCHRVVGAGGALGGWTGVLADKRLRLMDEGITATLSRVRGFERVRWTPHTGGTPSRR